MSLGALRCESSVTIGKREKGYAGGMRSISLRTLRFIVLGLVAAVGAHARAMHFDAQGGSDSASGSTAATAKRSFSILRGAVLKPGDSLLFKRGSRWQGDSLILSGAGTAEAPFVLSAYGDAALPKPCLENQGNLLVLRDARHLVVEDLELAGAHGGCIEMRDSTVFHATVRRVDAHDCGSGINISGGDIVVRDNTIHDGHMVVNTSTRMDDDYGATGIGFSRLDGCRVHGNRLWNLVAPSYDYGVDGGAFEFWKTVRNCDIFGNFAFRADGLTEFGGQDGDSVIGVAVHHNIAFEVGVIACFHIDDSASLFGVGYDSVRFDNNLSVTRGGRAASFHVVADGGVLERPDRIRIRNNILVTDSSNYNNYQGEHSEDPTWVHEHNLLWNPVNKTFSGARVRGTGELFGDPQFANPLWKATSTIDTNLSSYGLQASSPARGTGLDLGYASDYFGKAASKDGKVDMGPFSPDAFDKARRRVASPFLARAWGGRLEIHLGPEAASTLRIQVVDASGRTLVDGGVVVSPEGDVATMELPHGTTPTFARISFVTKSGTTSGGTVAIPPMAD